ncbi:DUF4296 domain-containing protein [Mariniflexile sp. AS56]|uniref:DUF4296 domain-containing protein n=1 Tax=Mariniflexile sp. AS56 TaxID=3063957 RepID=UPI0026EEBAAA|nr:DUF4296 domain-containing protein [Mariniflexile sp. AS56]MDO7170930.1 DUF4296 domain-containing protein [Mariniflexile sp. AS56]
MIIKRFIPCFCLVLLVVACNSFGAPNKPSNLISKKNMVNILIDARLLGSATYFNKQKMQARGVELDKYVFEKYGIDSLQFALSNAYYAYHIKEYEEIYTSITDSLEKLKAVLKEQKLKEEEEKKITDSINALKPKDSLDIVIKKDTLTDVFLKKKIKREQKGLISPVSDMNLQSEKLNVQ